MAVFQQVFRYHVPEPGARFGHPTHVELYDLQQDPGQADNVYDDNEEVARELHKRLVSRLADCQTDSSYIESRNRLP